MNKQKKARLHQTYQRFLNAGLGLESAEALNEIVDDRLMGFGTALDEKILNLEGLQELLARQKEQSGGLDMRWEIKPLAHYTSADENTAFFADELFLHTAVGGQPLEMYLRFSIVLSCVNNQWKVIHWHGSKPENVQSHEDTFGIENWKQKAVALEKLVEERTAALQQKNHELEIEASLERVRAVALSMNQPADMLQVCTVISQQLQALNVQEIRNVQTAIIYEGKGTYLNYEFYAKHDKAIITETSYTNNKLHQAFANRMLKGPGEFFATHLNGDALKSWFAYQKTTNVFIDDCLNAASSLNYYWYSLGPVALGISTYEALRDEDVSLFKRFTNVFDLAYRRYLDIEKAEAQAREAQIQLALERVRARTMAMQKSDELAEAAALLFQQVKSLGFHLYSSGFTVWENNQLVSWMCNADGSVNPPFKMPATDVAWHAAQYESWKNGEAFLVHDFSGKEMQAYYRYLRSFPLLNEAFNKSEAAGVKTPERQVHNVANFSHGNLLFITLRPYPEAQDVFERFATVFDQTYTRFLDLQKAEAQAREAQIEAALERVRSRTLAMQKSDELADASAVLFQQLMGLGIEPNRMYINIIKDENANAEFWITDEDGSKVSMAYEDNMNNNSTFKKMYEGWKEKKSTLVIDMRDDELKEYFHYLMAINVPFKGGLEQKRRLQYIAYFSKGFIGMASPEEQPPETLQLLERFAYVFNLTFTRFNDLQMAEAHAAQAEQDLLEIKAARKKAEETLLELQATQKQLIQSEKMASLGELTAGIAHEIQNPLNFVNNFSEVSNELLEEMLEELATGNRQLATEIAADVKQNLEKIAHHGKRADAIVKGMLQHSRASTGQREPTDINALTDEYLRLAYHGLRAKDKTFNAKLETSFDESVGKIPVVPQDLGRVVLNLINNAFYAVNEKKKVAGEGFEPLVQVATVKTNAGVEIKIKDNGTGIPQAVLNKIYQPFFTTKPTGEGTGLGLSLSYDIVTKGHGGELTVETEEGKGTAFTIILPAVAN